MKTGTRLRNITWLGAIVVLFTGISAGIYKAECPPSKWMVEARLVNASQKPNTAQITFTFNHPTFGLGVQTVNINFGKIKKQVTTDVKGQYKLSLKPGNHVFTIKQYGCADLKQGLAVKNKEQISVKVTWALKDPKVKC